MPELVWTLTCRTILTDAESNSVSYIEAIHGLAARKLPSRLPKVMLGTVWKSSTDDDALRMRLRVEAPDGSELVAMELPEVKFDHQYQRLNVNMAGMEVPEAGEYSIVVERFTRRRWREEARVPFNIAVANDQMAQTEGVPQSTPAD